MSRTPHARSAVLVGAVLLSLAACGSGDDVAGSAASTPATESPAATGGSDFCTQAAGIDQRVDSAMSDLEGDDPSVADAFTQIAEELRAMDPPEQIASDWDAMAAGLDRMAEAFADFDITDPESLTALEEAEGDLSTASGNVETYLRDECGIEP
ncbi:MAG TPA: hypothetical protein VFG13_13240 [Blastococcus sp.]|nr:hypothetical protein [Blastococcus sp.]